eukprot:COSAG04_NODE_3747_length_2561_cov_3.287977_3_plen_53_part_00
MTRENGRVGRNLAVCHLHGVGMRKDAEAGVALLKVRAAQWTPVLACADSSLA